VTPIAATIKHPSVACEVVRSLSIKTMLRDEGYYRRQRHQNFLHLFDSESGRRLLRLYFLSTCPLPVALGVALALVDSSLMLLGLLIFTLPLASIGSTIVVAIRELIDTTHAFDARRVAARGEIDLTPSDDSSRVDQVGPFGETVTASEGEALVAKLQIPPSEDPASMGILARTDHIPT
jgi:hypothetical protein